MTREARPMGRISVRESEARRRRRIEAERLVNLAEHLPFEEGQVIRVIYGRGVSAAELARMIDGPARTIQRHVRRLRRRITSPMFAFVATHRHGWPPLRREVGESIVLRGESMRTTSHLLGVSLHQVRLELERIRAEADVRAEMRGTHRPATGSGQRSAVSHQSSTITERGPEE